VKNISILIIISLILICATGVFAAPAEQDLVIPDSAPGSAPGAGFGLWDFFRTLLVLALIVGAVYGVLHLLRKWRPRLIQADDKQIKVEATKVLAPGRIVHIIEVEGRRFLVGTSDHSVQLLAELDKKEQEQ